jgi:hypothetical protein
MHTLEALEAQPISFSTSSHYSALILQIFLQGIKIGRLDQLR